MDRSSNARDEAPPDISPNDSASNPPSRSRAIEKHGTATTQAASWSGKLQQLDTPHLPYYQPALAKVMKWLSDPAFDTPPPDPPFSDDEGKGTLKNQVPPPNLSNTPQDHARTKTSNWAPEEIADYAIMTLGCFAILPLAVVIATATTVVLIPCLIKKGASGGRKDRKGSGE